MKKLREKKRANVPQNQHNGLERRWDLKIKKLLSRHLRKFQRHCSHTAHPSIPTSGYTQGLFRIAAPPPEVHRRKHQVASGLPSEGDAAMLLSVFGSVQQCPFWFSILGTLPTDGNVSWVAESDWVSVPSREETPTMSLHPSPVCDSLYVPPSFSYVSFLALETLIGTALGREGGKLRPPWGHGANEALKGYISWDLFFLCSNRWGW